VDLAPQGAAAVAAVRPPANRRIMDRFFAAINRAPGHPALVYAVLFFLSAASLHLIFWLSGGQPFPVPALDITVTSTWWVMGLAVLDYLHRQGARSLERFSPCLPPGDPAIADARSRLTSIPNRVAIASTATGILFTVVTLYFDPTFFGLMRGGPAADAAELVFASLNAFAMCLLVYVAVRNLLTVTEMHRRATFIDLYRPSPLFAFSGLTARAAVLGALIGNVFALTMPGSIDNPVNLAAFLLVPALVIPLFVLPLWGMHGRMAAEKERLAGESRTRLEGALAAIHASQKSGELGGVPDQKELLEALFLEKADIAALKTWPWQPGLPQAVLTLVLLPLIVFLLQGLLGRVLAL